MPRIPRMQLFIIALVITFAAAFAPSAGAQQNCSDEVIVGNATSQDRREAFTAANLAWEKAATAKLGAKLAFHVNPRTACDAAKDKNGYTCSVSAKACDKPAARQRAFIARSTCHPSASGCEVCCFNPASGRTNCRPICM